MTSRKKIIQAVGAGALLALFASSASAALLNSGFENPDASDSDVGGTDGWTTFEDVYTNSTVGPGFGPVSHGDNAGTLGAGTQSLKMFGPFTSTGAASGAFQTDDSVVAGQTYELEAWVMNWVVDPFQNLGILQLQFWDGPNGTGNQLGGNIEQVTDPFGTPGFVDLSVAQDGDEVSDWTRMSVSGIAPAGTQSATVYLLHIQTADPCCNGGAIYWDDVSLKALFVPIAIDIKPGSDPNPVNPKSKGVIPVAVLGSMDFDATQVDFSTVEFGPGKASPVHDGHVENVNGDGFEDMVFHFKTQGTGITCGDTEATLSGETFGGDAFTGTDSVKTAGCK
ncbi:hypothetical protein N9985_02040 [Gammaproteobacteria bacterium]|jgi:hypothetical protein|nr:hypothetical protein [Gammaproteobacteria bacterium]